MGSPLPPAPDAARLRERARLLRQLAARLEQATLLDLAPLVGSETWLGPRPFECAADVGRMIGRFRAAASELRDSARLLDNRAATSVGGPR